MNRSEPSPEKRSQRDYNLGFKLAVISQVEKGELTYKQAKRSMEFKVEVQFWFGYENSVH